MDFQKGDRVRLIAPYWVASPGDCKNDGNVMGLKVGKATGTLTEIENRNDGIAVVSWDDGRNGNLRVNFACLGDEVDEQDLNEVLRSISRTFQDRKLRWKGGQ